MYLLDPNHPSELFHARHDALLREARKARLASERWTGRRKEKPMGKRRAARFLGGAIALWGGTSTPCFRA